MTANGWIQIALFFLTIIVCVKPLGRYMARVFEGEINFLAPVERFLYRLCGIKGEEQHWTTYTIAMLAFSIAGFVSLYLIQRLQAVLPFNPQAMTPVTPDLAFNTSTSFITNTNWQSYSGETTMSYLVQMLGLTVHNFLSAATGIALAIALVRGFARRSAKTLGNFWVDMTRCILYVLLPLSVVIAFGPGVAGRAAKSGRLYPCHRPGWRQATHRPRPGRFAGSHQDAGHQWRRFLQRQFGASV